MLIQPDLLIYNNKSIKFINKNLADNINKLDEIIQKYFNHRISLINSDREYKYLIPTCPLSHEIKYQYKIDTSGIELICPTHGTKKVKFD